MKVDHFLDRRKDDCDNTISRSRKIERGFPAKYSYYYLENFHSDLLGSFVPLTYTLPTICEDNFITYLMVFDC